MIIVRVLRIFGIAMRMVTHVAKKRPTSDGRQARVEDQDVDEGKLWYDFSALRKTSNNGALCGRRVFESLRETPGPHTRAQSSVHKSFAKHRPGHK